MGNSSITIERITKDNYHMFDDMVYWRMHGIERTDEDKCNSQNKRLDNAFSELERQGFFVFAAHDKRRFVGWISLIYIPKIGKWNRGVIFVEELWTAPNLRRRGIATKLMQKAFEIQQETGALKVRLYTDNAPAEELYKKCGLEIKNKAVFMESKDS